MATTETLSAKTDANRLMFRLAKSAISPTTIP